MSAEERHVLVVANETVVGRALIDSIVRRAAEGPVRVTVCCPVNNPREGYVVYETTRRTAARRRLDRTLEKLRAAGIPADGYVVDADPAAAVRDALAQLEPPVAEVVVSTHPQPRSGWLRRDVVDRIRRATGPLPLEHVVVDLNEEGGETNVLVLANETVLGEPLLDRVRERARTSPSSFLIICPQSDPTEGASLDAERRLRRALTILRGEGIEAHGQIGHPDPYLAAMHAIRDERVDEVIVSTFPRHRSGWLRKGLVDRLRSETKLPVEHVVGEPEPAEVSQ